MVFFVLVLKIFAVEKMGKSTFMEEAELGIQIC